MNYEPCLGAILYYRVVRGFFLAHQALTHDSSLLALVDTAFYQQLGLAYPRSVTQSKGSRTLARPTPYRNLQLRLMLGG